MTKTKSVMRSHFSYAIVAAVWGSTTAGSTDVTYWCNLVRLPILSFSGLYRHVQDTISYSCL